MMIATVKISVKRGANPVFELAPVCLSVEPTENLLEEAVSLSLLEKIGFNFEAPLFCYLEINIDADEEACLWITDQ